MSRNKDLLKKIIESEIEIISKEINGGFSDNEIKLHIFLEFYFNIKSFDVLIISLSDL